MGTSNASLSHPAYPWAVMMVRMGARACVVSQITGLAQLDARTIWKQIMGESSPSGQQPNDMLWYTRTPQRRSHAALLVRFYDKACATLPDYAAFAHAYYHYARMTASPATSNSWVSRDEPAFRRSEQDYVIPFGRGFFLCQSYTDDTFAGGRRKCELIIRRCRKCQGQYMSHDSEAAQVCPNCGKDHLAGDG